METVDLDKLSAELTAAGRTSFRHSNQNGEYLYLDDLNSPIVDVWDDGTVFMTANEIPVDIGLMTIIARHVAPVAPDPGLREAIAKRIKAVEHNELVDLGYVEAITTAVLSVLAERGVR